MEVLWTAVSSGRGLDGSPV